MNPTSLVTIVICLRGAQVTELLEAASAIRAGQIVGIPTDTVYGLAVDPNQPGAVDLLFAAKQRDRSAPLVILVSDIEEADGWGQLSDKAAADAKTHWPGALTLIVEAVAPLPSGVGDPSSKTVGIRSPDHPIALGLLDLVGPLAVTSANLSGQRPAGDDVSARSIFGESVGVYLDGAVGAGEASTVVDYTCDPPAVLRQGGVQI